MLVKLNVGGQLFVTTQETIANFPSMLCALVQHSNPATMVDDYMFIDRDPHTFRWILNYLRGSKILPPKMSVDMYLLLEEAQYFAVDGLVTRIGHMLNPAFVKGDHISVCRSGTNTNFTVLEIEDSGYLATRGGHKYRLDSSEQMQHTQIAKGDVITAYRNYKWTLGICMSVFGSDCTVQFNNEQVQTEFKLSGVRF
jgi:hypothetical protein|tara:strand:+ start:1136 stop:1726 length:591 start_codon:yes stop_codon:yes gene_type:complete